MKKINEIQTLNDLAIALQIPLKILTYILYHKRPDNLYHTFTIPKKSGGVRTIHAPDDKLKYIQKKLATKLTIHQNSIQPFNQSTVSHGFIKGRDIVSNANNHKNKRIIINVDIDNFFGSFHFGRVKGYFHKNKHFKLPEKLAIAIANLACYQAKLPQGAPTSPVITNLICNILDMRILGLTKKYKLYYTRYVDDLTFSTNDKHTITNTSTFLLELDNIIENFGLKINDSKTRISYPNSRQEVTGITVNEKLNANKRFIKETRAMLDALYKTGEFHINGKDGTLNQLEGRFSFINNIDRKNNILFQKQHNKKLGFYHLSTREKQYQKFLFFKYFYQNEKPLIITEGKTDILYLKAALKNLHKNYPTLVTKNKDNTFNFHVSFLNRTKRLRYFLNLKIDGADTLQNIYKFHTDQDNINYPNYAEELRKNNIHSTNPVMLIFDNELDDNNKPLTKFMKSFKANKKEHLKDHLYSHLINNLYLITNPLVNDKKHCEMEDLFENDLLHSKVEGKTFNLTNDRSNDNQHGKTRFAKHVLEHYESIDFNEFIPILDNIKEIVANEGINK